MQEEFDIIVNMVAAKKKSIFSSIYTFKLNNFDATLEELKDFEVRIKILCKPTFRLEIRQKRFEINLWGLKKLEDSILHQDLLVKTDNEEKAKAYIIKNKNILNHFMLGDDVVQNETAQFAGKSLIGEGDVVRRYVIDFLNFGVCLNYFHKISNVENQIYCKK